jgi:hypothetical protein
MIKFREHAKDRRLNRFNKILFLPLITVDSMGVSTVYAAGPTTVNLGAADNFAVLAGSTLTNTGLSVLNGDLGLSPGSSVTGFPPGTVSGTKQVTNTIALQAQTDLTAAYLSAAGRTPVLPIGTQLGGATLNTGVYNSADGTFGLTGTLTLNAQGDASAVFIFKTASTLITAGASVVSLINGAQPCNVFWQVGSSATLGTTSTFKGNILALTSATLTTGANVEGRVLARNGAVTLDSKLRAGDLLYIEDGKGKSVPFVLRGSRIYNSDDSAPEVFASVTGSNLNLVTCAGVWDESKYGFTKRLVVFTDVKN